MAAPPDMKKVKLFAPPAYWDTPAEDVDKITGGCGPGRFGDWLVPDSLLFLSIKKACRIHDFMYAIGETIDDKERSDRVFLNNMLRLIMAGAKFWLLRNPRMRMAYGFYEMVKRYGGPAFWHGKNSDKEEKEA